MIPVRHWRLILAAAAFLLPPAAAGAQRIVSSPGPGQVAVTIYRNPDRDPGDALDLQWLDGYALVSETRRISLPAGESTIRFEGVAGGIMPQTAIVSGFPEGIVERNRDAYLLSPETILDRSLGRRVHIRRTSAATGAVREQRAVIRSGAEGAVVLQTARGFEALRCTGVPETILYDRVPAELSPRPTLSVRARAARAVTATITLSYLAAGFDWQANYIARLSPDGGRIDLFAWLTLASNDETSFVDADTQAVAGDLRYDRADPEPPEGGPLELRCWPAARTSDIPLEEYRRTPLGARLPGMVVIDDSRTDGESIVVTGTRVMRPSLQSTSPVSIMTSEQLNLGDLKLYRIPEPVTVAANSQKQVALLVRPDVRADLVYRQRLFPAESAVPSAVPMVLVTRNRSEEGLGVPLPAGSVALFAQSAGRPLLLGESELADRAVGEDVEVWFGAAAGVTTQVSLVGTQDRRRDFLLTVASDRPAPIRFEAEFPAVGDDFRPELTLPRRDGFPFWATVVPANGTATLRFSISSAR